MAASQQHSQRWSPLMSTGVLLVAMMLVLGWCDVARVEAQNPYGDGEVRRRKVFLDGQMHRGRNVVPHRPRRQRSDRPNIVMIMTDDQDVLLGSLKAMPKLQDYLTRQGAFFENMFVSTPMCCPSRSTILTGLYVHNHNVYTNNDNCSSPQWIRQHEPRTFATYLQSAGYTTGYFGKYLNKYNGTYTPVGWDKWVGLVRNSRFYNYTLSYGGQLQHHSDNYYKDYLTDRIANDSVAFLKRVKQLDPSKPLMMVLSVPAPHGPEDAAPQYQHMFVNNTDHRTPSWNLAPNFDKQWLLRHTKPMTPQFKIFTDLLQRRRLQTLQSVDDLIEKVSSELDMLGELENTYMLYTSDHGYHLGQFGLIKGKSMAFDFDTRVPLIIKGPGIKPGSRIHNVAANVDLAATLLDMGGVHVPPHMDGQSLLPLLKATSNSQGEVNHFLRIDRPWRDSVLLERGKVSKRMWKLRMKEEKTQLMQQNQKNLLLYLTPKQQKILRQCSKPRKAFQLPCRPNQKWYCQQDSKGRMRLHKCRHANREGSYHANNVLLQGDQSQVCLCRDGRMGVPTSSSLHLSSADSSAVSKQERQRHRRFLRQQKRKDRSRILREKRSLLSEAIQLKSDTMSSSYPVRLSPGFDLFTRRCRILSNQTVSCDQDIYQDYSQWEAHRERVDEMIKEYRKILDDLRNIRNHLSENRPPLYIDSMEHDEGNGHGGSGHVNTRLHQPASKIVCDCDTNLHQNRGSDAVLDRHTQRQYRREQKLLQRAQRREERSQRRKGRKKKSCNGNNMKCFSHDNNHWKTPPYWHLFEEEEGGDVAQGCPSLRHFKRFNYPPCYQSGLECTLMDNCHWKTPPLWTYGPFCFCSNANNNTYWCIRTVNETSNFLYCEYITNFITFYDMAKDPHQLHNVAKKLNYGILQQLHDQLAILKVCQGRDDCDLNNHKDSRLPISGHADWRESVYEDSSGEGDDDDQDRAAFYHRNNNEVLLEKLHSGHIEEEDYEDMEEEDMEPDPDFF